MTLSALMMACTTWRAFQADTDFAPRPEASAQATAVLSTSTSSATIVSSVIAESSAPEATVAPVASSEIVSPVISASSALATVLPEPEPLISEVRSEVRPPQAVVEPVRILGGGQRTVPDGTSVVWGGCASDGTCYSFNFYWAPTNEVVMQTGEGDHKVQHELCHAHQHWSINGGATLSPSDYDLQSWYATAEGGNFTEAVAGLPWPWTHSAENGLEDFAWTCAYWYSDAEYLLQVSPQRYAWAAAYLP